MTLETISAEVSMVVIKVFGYLRTLFLVAHIDSRYSDGPMGLLGHADVSSNSEETTRMIY